MAKPVTLLFEIWDDPETNSVGMALVTRDGDALRRRVSPRAHLIHSFRAVSDFDAFQQSHDWHGFGIWRPEPDWEERFFTQDELETQLAYLAERAKT